MKGGHEKKVTNVILIEDIREHHQSITGHAGGPKTLKFSTIVLNVFLSLLPQLQIAGFLVAYCNTTCHRMQDKLFAVFKQINQTLSLSISLLWPAIYGSQLHSTIFAASAAGACPMSSFAVSKAAKKAFPTESPPKVLTTSTSFTVNWSFMLSFT